jgi:hypothetical protein
MKLSHIICLIIAGLGGLGGLGAASDDFLSSFELSDVQLHTNSFQHQAASSNLDYLLQLDPGDFISSSACFDDYTPPCEAEPHLLIA